MVTVACLLVDRNVDFLTAQEPPLPLVPSAYEKTYSFVYSDESLTDFSYEYLGLFDEDHEVLYCVFFLFFFI